MTEVSVKNQNTIKVIIANEEHMFYSGKICEMINQAAKIRGTGIAKRKPEYIRSKIHQGKAIIALVGNKIIGFCYIETWEHNRYVANSGLIVDPDYREFGLAKQIKTQAFSLSRKRFPEAKIFGLTTSLPVMKINSELGYRPVSFSELTKDEVFWEGCRECVNHDILRRTKQTMCLCTAMIFNPEFNAKSKFISK